jgi:hypothetical protein
VVSGSAFESAGGLEFPLSIQYEGLDVGGDWVAITFVTVNEDGSVEYADGYEPDAEARAFWEKFGADIAASAARAVPDR